MKPIDVLDVIHDQIVRWRADNTVLTPDQSEHLLHVACKAATRAVFKFVLHHPGEFCCIFFQPDHGKLILGQNLKREGYVRLKMYSSEYRGRTEEQLFQEVLNEAKILPKLVSPYNVLDKLGCVEYDPSGEKELEKPTVA